MIPLLNLKEKTVFEKNLHIRFSFAPAAKMALFAFFPGRNSKVNNVAKFRLLRFFNNFDRA